MFAAAAITDHGAMTAIQALLARTALGVTVHQAAELTETSHETIVAIEGNNPRVRFSTRARVRAAYEAAGVRFLEDGFNIRYRPPRA